MLVCLSESRTARLIQEMEGRPDLSLEEITEMFNRYGVRLFKHLQSFGLHYTAMLGVRGDLCDIRLQIADVPYSQGDPREPVIEGLMLVNPIHVSVEVSDLSVLAPAMAQGLADYWPAVQEYLTKITPHELLNRLEKASWVVINESRKTVPAELNEVGYDQWAVQNNLPLLNSHTLREQRKQAEITAEQERNSRQLTRGVSTDWNLSPREWD